MDTMGSQAKIGKDKDRDGSTDTYNVGNMRTHMLGRPDQSDSKENYAHDRGNSIGKNEYASEKMSGDPSINSN